MARFGDVISRHRCSPVTTAVSEQTAARKALDSTNLTNAEHGRSATFTVVLQVPPA